MTYIDYIRSYKKSISDEEAHFIIWNMTAWPACGFGAYLDKQICDALRIKWNRKRFERMYKRITGKKYKYKYAAERIHPR